MQDLGYHENFDDVDVVPEIGYTTLFVEAIEGHIYALYTPDGNFAKIMFASSPLTKLSLTGHTSQTPRMSNSHRL